MALDKYGTGDDPYCYPGSNVLQNLLNIEDDDELAEAEAELTELAVEEWVAANIAGVSCDYEPITALFDRCIGASLND